CSKTWRAAGCWTTRWSCAWASSGGRRRSTATAAANTGRRCNPSCSQGPACRPAASTAPPIAPQPSPRTTRSPPRTWARRFCTASASTRIWNCATVAVVRCAPATARPSAVCSRDEVFECGVAENLVGWAKRALLAPAHHSCRRRWAGANCVCFAHPTDLRTFAMPAVSALVLAALVVGADGPEKVQQPLFATVELDRGESRDVTLPDGSKVA